MNMSRHYEGRASLPPIQGCPVCADLRIDHANILTYYTSNVLVQSEYSACSIIAMLPRLLEAAESGCESCTVLKRAIEGLSEHDAKIDFEDEKLGVVFIFCDGSVLNGTVGRIKRHDNDPTGYTIYYDPIEGQEGKWLRLDFQVYTPVFMWSPWSCIGMNNHEYEPRNAAWPWYGGVTYHIPTDSFSDACFDRISNWHMWCCTLHPHCPFSCAGALPKRALDVGTIDEPKLFIHEGGSAEEQEYIALSHCWGSILPILSTKETLPRWKENIPWEAMPKTFQDVVTICRRLKVRYLWIDSLCIVQDDTEDWAIESAKMASIYQDAFLVVSATLSEDGRGGCFSKRPAYIEIPTLNGKVFARKTPLEHRYFFWDDPTISYMENFDRDQNLTSRSRPVLNRAWCFQERLLGTRVLHYMPTELLWECRSQVSCECSWFWDFTKDSMLSVRRLLGRVKEGVQQNNNYDQKKLSYKQNWVPVVADIPERGVQTVGRRLAISTVQDGNIGQLFPEWNRIVGNYSQKAITYRRDTFPALSGVARRFASEATGRYFAGLWESDFVGGLLWKSIAREGRTAAVQDGYICPSWSWAAPQRHVGFIEKLNAAPVDCVEVIDIVCTAKGSDPFGQLVDARVDLRGQVMRRKLAASDSDSKLIIDGGTNVTEIILDRWEERARLSGTEVMCLKIRTDSFSGGGNMPEGSKDLMSKDQQHRWLVLLRILDVDDERYERVGVIEHMACGDKATEKTVRIV